MFENIIGHERNKRLLEKHVVLDNISHAYLFSGPKGVGKQTLAREFAKQVLKVNKLESSPDFKYISKREDKKDIIIEQIRKELIEDVYQLPVSGNKKVYIIDDAECLNIASQNALLKTLEEPPKYVVIILISSNISAFLTTVVSRVNIVKFKGIETDILKQYLQEHYQQTLSENLLKYVDGSIGQAIQIINNRLFEKFEQVDTLYGYIAKKDTIQALLLVNTVKLNEYDLLDYLEFLLFINLHYSCTKYVEKAKVRLKNNGNYDIVVDNMILNIMNHIV